MTAMTLDASATRTVRGRFELQSQVRVDSRLSRARFKSVGSTREKPTEITNYISENAVQSKLESGGPRASRVASEYKTFSSNSGFGSVPRSLGLSPFSKTFTASLRPQRPDLPDFPVARSGLCLPGVATGSGDGMGIVFPRSGLGLSGKSLTGLEDSLTPLLGEPRLNVSCQSRITDTVRLEMKYPADGAVGIGHSDVVAFITFPLPR